MRLCLLFLAAGLVGTFRAQNTLGDVTHMTFTGGLPYGAILTFYIKHIGNDDYPESVWINFYDLPMVEMDKVYDAPAHLRIERKYKKFPVYSNSFKNYEFRQEDEVVREQPLDEELPSNGWWRIDVIKHDEYSMNVFLQGYWSGVREFKMSLNGIRSVYVMPSANVDQKSVQIRIKLPNSNVPPMSVEKFKTDLYSKRFVTGLNFYAFPVGSHMEFAAVLRSSGGAKYDTPALLFVNTDEKGGPAPQGTPEFALKLSQHWDGYTQRTYIGDSRGQTECTQEKPNGDLQHIRIERVAKTIVTMQIFYKPSTGAKGVECRHTVPDDLAKYLDQHFQIESRDGALVYHLDHSVPRFLQLQPRFLELQSD